MKYLNDDGLLYLVQKIKTWLNGKVDKVDGKGLSTNDYTTTEKNKLSRIETEANKTIINNTVTSTSTTEALAAAQGKVLSDRIDAINNNMENLGAGDMLKSRYDIDNDGVVDDAEKLGGQLPSYYATQGDLSGMNEVITNIDNEVQSIYGMIPDDVSDLNNDAGYQTASDVNSIINGKGYQTASQVQTIVNNAVANITGIDFQVVTNLPTTGVKGVIYLKANSGSGNNIYDEYIWVNNKFEFIGTTQVDLSNYVQESDLVAITNAEIDTIVAS